MDNKKFGQFVLELRKEKGWTQQELAEKYSFKARNGQMCILKAKYCSA